MKSVALALIALVFVALPASASAAPEPLWEVPEGREAGAGAGQLDIPESIVADPLSGHVYIADPPNGRVAEFGAWGEFVRAWGWGVRNGASEPQTCGPGATPPSAGCLKGIAGSGPGQFGLDPAAEPGPAGGITIDAAGNLYVGDMYNHRIQKFDSDGNFLLMFGGEVDKGPNHPGNVCTADFIAEGDACGTGTLGPGDGQFERIYPYGAYIATGPAGTIFVGDADGRVQEFEADGSFKSNLVLEGLDDERIDALAIDGAGNFYVRAGEDNQHVYKFSPTGALLLTIDVELYLESPVTLDAAGNVYVVHEDSPSISEIPKRQEVIAFDSSGVPVLPEGSGLALELRPSGCTNCFAMLGLATNVVTATGGTDIYVIGFSQDGLNSFASAYGPPPDKWDPPAKPPLITAQYAASVDTDSALLGAQINPRFWKDTSYYVEWGTGKCSEGGCLEQQPASPGTLLGAGIVGNAATTKGVLLSGLSPGTTYHYRFVAQSGGGGPVHGVGPGEAEGTFTTPPPPDAPNASCPNRAFREGVSASLPDCRAYEMVSPVDKNGGDVVGLCDIACFRTEINQSSLDGERLTYSSYKAFGDAKSGPYSSQYIASRGLDGWSTHGISPPYTSGIVTGRVSDYATQAEFKAFSTDLSRAWLVDSSRLPLTSDAGEGFVNLYRQETGDGSLIALTNGEPQFAERADYELELQGRTPDGEHSIFTAAAALTPDATPTSKNQLYEFSNGGMHLVSILPDGSANPSYAFAGTLNPGIYSGSGHGATMLSHAISDDGSRVFWSSYSSYSPGIGGPANLYLRLNSDQPQSALSPGGKCTQPAKACTYPVSSGPAQFWTADPSGSAVLFSEEDQDLYSYDVASKAATLIAHKSLGVLGSSEDLSHIYFASTEALAPGAVAGERNLYLDEEGSMRFIAALSATDTAIGASAASAVDPRPVQHAVRVSPDGSHIAFMSTNSLTGYDNADVENGKADNEVYLYDADAKELSCVSCDPSGARPEGDELKGPYQRVGSATFHTGVWAGAWLNSSETSFYTPHALSEDGTRLFFNSFDALVPRDTNGAQDVYEWEAPGSGDCTTASASFAAHNNGCLSLISSGESPEDSVFVDATPDGSDVFFKTTSSLDPSDPGLIDIYDAREGGGFPPPPVPAPPCAGDACQSVPAAPLQQTAASEGFRGAGDLRPATSRACPKGKRRVRAGGKPRCVRKVKRQGKGHRGGPQGRRAHPDQAQ